MATEMGHGSKMIVTGDDSQTDLEPGTVSGLNDAHVRLGGIKGLSFVRLEKADIVRHRLVQNIVEAYERNGGAKRTSARPAAEPPLPNPDAPNAENT